VIKRVIDISEAAYLHLKHRQLLIDKGGETVGQVAIEDLGILLLQHPAIVLTQALIIACQKNNVIVVFCDDKHLPYSTILPIAEGNSLHGKVIKQQMAITEPTRKNIWQQIVRLKINSQATTLTLLDKNAKRLHRLATEVKSGDSSNCEAVASQLYWKLLFGKKFKRSLETDQINSLLNYGYAIVRAMIARSICGAGLHPTLGLFHHNQYNALCLADDIMEPFRPWVDSEVFEIVKNEPPEINQRTKKILLGLLDQSVIYNKKKMPLMVASHYLIADLKRCYNKDLKIIKYPELEKRKIR
jgi:CRISPR-associated protein Cas1